MRPRTGPGLKGKGDCDFWRNFISEARVGKGRREGEREGRRKDVVRKRGVPKRRKEIASAQR